ncbi:MAG: hypothetical protein II892_09635 [Fibrobacter sp.]|jgi:hypothetical protein|nr:hypothetical protein [Fibrobacter sp.]
MFEVLSVFYPTHYNFAALSILLTITIIWLLTKKNYRWTLILLVILVAFNIAIYKRTEGKTWTISFDEETSESSEVQEGPKTYTFSAHKNWTITDEKGKTHHWCWVEDWWAEFSSIDLVSAIWGDNKSKKMMKASEQRLNDNPQE